MWLIITLHMIQCDSRFSSLVNNFSVNSFSIIYLKLLANSGVSLFALITGYFGIKFSYKKIFELIFKTWLYSLIITTIFYLSGNMPLTSYVRYFIPLNSGHWYISAYVILSLLIIPFAGDKINTLPINKHFQWLAVGGIVLYVFFWLSFDIGTDVVLILYLYCLGRIVCKLKENNKINLKYAIGGKNFIVVICDNCKFHFIYP